MPFDWGGNEPDDRDPMEGYGEGPAEQPAPRLPPKQTISASKVAEVVHSIERSPEPVEESVGELSDVEYRLEKAQCYKALINSQLLTSDSDAAVEVEYEIQEFVRNQLRRLMGMEGPGIQQPVVLPFTDEQIEALKAIADKLLSRPTSPPPAKEAPKPVAVAPVKPVAPKREPQVQAVASPDAPKRGRGRPRTKPCKACGNLSCTCTKLTKAPEPSAPKPDASPARFETDSAGFEYKIVGDKRYKRVLVKDQTSGEVKEEWVEQIKQVRAANAKPMPSEQEWAMLAQQELSANLSKAPALLGRMIATELSKPSQEGN